MTGEISVKKQFVKARKTSRKHKHHLTGEEAYVVEIDMYPGDLPVYPIIDVDGNYFYYFTSCEGELYLSKVALAVDAGGNIVRKRIAPQSLAGIADDNLDRELTVLGETYDYFVEFIPLKEEVR